MIKDSKKEMIFSELNSLLTAGLDFSRAFELLISEEGDEKIKSTLVKIYSSVVKGNSLWISMEENGQFIPIDYGVIKIGEETGRIAEALAFLSDYYHKKIAQTRMINSAISYPLIIIFTATVVVVFMVLVIVPMFEQVYSRMGGELPVMTKLIIAFSKSFPVWMGVFSITGGISATVLYLLRNEDLVKRNTSALLLKLPLINTIIKKNYQSRFCKLLYLLTGSGVPLLYSIHILKDILTFYPYRASFIAISEDLQRGKLFWISMSNFKTIYNNKLITLIRVAEETNTLPEMLRKQGDELSVELEYKIRFLCNMLEPALILIVGAIVAIILISMYLPMFKLGGIMT
jgi:type IV pilus assembly protein PilC